jgi:hypothetical protein
MYTSVLHLHGGALYNQTCTAEVIWDGTIVDKTDSSFFN